MPFDLTVLAAGIDPTWVSFLRDWDRTLRAGNYPETTRYNYLLAAAQLARYLTGRTGERDAAEAAVSPTAVDKGHVEEFQTWMIDSRSPATALNKHKGLQQFFKWLVDEEEIDRSPMDRVRQPKTPRKLIPIIRDDDTKRILDSCKAPGSPTSVTRPSSGCTTTPVLGCRRWRICGYTTWTSTRTGCATAVREPRTAGSGSARRPAGRSAGTCAPGRVSPGSVHRSCGLPSAAVNRCRPTVSRSCCGGVGYGQELTEYMRTGGATTTPTNGNSPAATAAI